MNTTLKNVYLSKLSKTLTIRYANLNDLEVIHNIESICFPVKEAATFDSIKNRLVTFPKSFLVANIGDKTVGFINGAIIQSSVIKDEMYENSNLHNPDAPYQSIFGLDVLPEYQSCGIAQELMKAMINLSKENSKKGLTLTCKEKLIGFYEQFGFKNRGISESTHGNVTWYDMFLEL